MVWWESPQGVRGSGESRLSLNQDLSRPRLKLSTLNAACSSFPLVSDKSIGRTIVVREGNKFWRANLLGESREFQTFSTAWLVLRRECTGATIDQVPRDVWRMEPWGLSD